MSITTKVRKGAEPKESTLVTTAPALLRAAQAAELCGISRPTWVRLNSAGKVPAGRKLGLARLWSRKEILAWIDAQMPDRETWAEIWAKRKNKIDA